MADPDDEALLTLLGGFVARLSFEDLPAPVVERAKLIFQHNLLVALAARREHVPGQDRADWPDRLPPAESATRLTDGRLAPADRAVVTNALAMGARAQHDEHPGAISHFGSTVLPPLLAVAEQHGIGGTQLLTAMVAGYEVGGRLGAASVQATSRRGLRPTGLYGPLAGAAAAGKAMGLSPGALTTALAFAANTSAGVTQTWLRGTDEWRYQTAFASRNGYASARLAADGGLHGAPDTMEGANGFNRAFADAVIDNDQVLDGLGTSWAVEDVLLKPYPVCAFNQAPVQQLLSLLQEHRFTAQEVRHIEVRMTEADRRYPGVDNTAPVQTRAAALMCLRTCLALAVLHDDVDLEHLDSAGAEGVHGLAQRVDLIADDCLGTHMTTVTVSLADGTLLTSGAAAPVVYDDEVSRSLVTRLQPLTGLTEDETAELVATVQSLERAADVRPLLRLITVSGARRVPGPAG